MIRSVREQWPVNSSYRIKDSRTLFAKLKHQVRKQHPLHYKIDVLTQETLLPFRKSNVEKRLELFEQTDPIGYKFKVKKIFPNTYEIRRI